MLQSIELMALRPVILKLEVTINALPFVLALRAAMDLVHLQATLHLQTPDHVSCSEVFDLFPVQHQDQVTVVARNCQQRLAEPVQHMSRQAQQVLHQRARSNWRRQQQQLAVRDILIQKTIAGQDNFTIIRVLHLNCILPQDVRSTSLVHHYHSQLKVVGMPVRRPVWMSMLARHICSHNSIHISRSVMDIAICSIQPIASSDQECLDGLVSS